MSKKNRKIDTAIALEKITTSHPLFNALLTAWERGQRFYEVSEDTYMTIFPPRRSRG